MLATLILLYALNASADVPTGCFVAAWILCVIKAICQIIMFTMKFGDYHDRRS